MVDNYTNITFEKRLKFTLFNNCENVVTIDLHNGYSVIAISGFDQGKHIYKTTLFLKENTTETWKLIEGINNLEFIVAPNRVNSAVLKLVSELKNEGFFTYYIDRYEYELKCFDKGNEIFEKENVSEFEYYEYTDEDYEEIDTYGY